MKKAYIIILIAVVLILAVILIIFFTYKGKKDSDEAAETPQAEEQVQEIEFSANIFDPNEIKNIVPLGELNGGYDEVSTLGGVMMNIKEKIYQSSSVKVYAPTQMTLESYAFFEMPPEPPSWRLSFSIEPDLTITFDHLDEVTEKVMDATASVPASSSAGLMPKEKITLSAGEHFANTTGTSKAHNWNIYLYDRNQQNEFLNIERLSQSEGVGKQLLTAVCPFKYYNEETKKFFIDLMGYHQAGESSDCGSVSHDVKGTVSGLWFLKESPFSIFKNSAGSVNIYQVDHGYYEISSNSASFKDPQEVTNEHCYNFSDAINQNRSVSGYLYFKVISDNQMQMSFGASGSCPASFPAQQAKTYYR